MLLNLLAILENDMTSLKMSKIYMENLFLSTHETCISSTNFTEKQLWLHLCVFGYQLD